ncbi:uncharacterized protein LOC124537742 [Vanessa cardui]|uniref:uncharacterized protein LOC124537742 n=1 Tax=Vanessa cardui TaxID=171605 RepID=UPI001F12BAC8|nr:uncharacterized protein LOC124537742 [Vanessa cardui]
MEVITKESSLKNLSKDFDPLGLLSPLVITMKMLLQRLWLDKLSWDEPLSPVINLQWQTIVKALCNLNEIRIPRMVVCHSYEELELHIFTDASERAYGACAYVRSVNDAGECSVRLLMAKSRVAPLKTTSIPRLELMGAIVGIRLYEKDYTPLTPGHFLIGRPLTSLPQKNYENQDATHLSRYQRIEQLRQHFWTRWSKEFISELQQRTKWRSCKDNLKLDSLVVVKEENIPPLKWRLGRIVAVHPGSDGIVRVADIKTSAGVIRRAFNRICPLPVSPVLDSSG